jgi:transposase-like protein
MREDGRVDVTSFSCPFCGSHKGVEYFFGKHISDIYGCDPCWHTFQRQEGYRIDNTNAKKKQMADNWKNKIRKAKLEAL